MALQIAVYPPGIPLLAKGEVITLPHVQALNNWRQILSSEHGNKATNALPSGTCITGCKDTSLCTILVFDEVQS